MTLKSKLYPGLKTGTLLGNVILSVLVDLSLKGIGDEVDLGELARALDIGFDELCDGLQKLQNDGRIYRPELTPWNELSSVSVGLPTIHLSGLQLSLPEQEKDVDRCPFKAMLLGEQMVELDAGGDTYRVACVAGQVGHEMTIAKKLGKDDFQIMVDTHHADTVGVAVAWAREYLLAVDGVTSDEKAIILGIETGIDDQPLEGMA